MVLLSDKHPIDLTIGQELPPTFHYAWVILQTGRWVAYRSNDTGEPEIYVDRFPELGNRQPVSQNGGIMPVWSPDGRELFYLVQ